MEDWEKEEMAAMWKFQGQCDAAKVMHENRKHTSSISTQAECCGVVAAPFGNDHGVGGVIRSGGEGENNIETNRKTVGITKLVKES